MLICPQYMQLTAKKIF